MVEKSAQKPLGIKDPGEWFVIVIRETKDPMGDVEFRGGVNGQVVRIQREVAAPCPAPILEVLANAKQDVYYEREDAQTGKRVRTRRTVLAYPYEIRSRGYKTRAEAEAAAALEAA